MRRVFLALLAGVLLTLPAVPAAAQAQDAGYQSRLKAAKAYADTMSTREMVQNMMSELAKNPQLGVSQADLTAIQGRIDFAKIDAMALDGLAKTFSEQELQELARFYGSPVGKSISAKMPNYISTIMPVIQQEVMTAVMSYMATKGKPAQ